MDCKICFDKYDSKSQKPIVLIPCGHSFCKKCALHLTKCSICRTYIKDMRPNFGIIDFLDEKHKYKYASSEPHRYFKVEQHNEKRYAHTPREIERKLDRAVIIIAKNVAFN